MRPSTACQGTHASGRGSPAENTTCPSSDGARGGLLGETGGEVIPGDALLLASVAPAHRGGASLDLAVAQDDHHRHLLLLGEPDLVLHPAVGPVDVDAKPATSQEGRELVRGITVPVGDRDQGNLDGRDPERESAPEMLDQDADEPLE